jgi:hypothetical protein
LSELDAREFSVNFAASNKFRKTQFMHVAAMAISDLRGCYDRLIVVLQVFQEFEAEQKNAFDP